MYIKIEQKVVNPIELTTWKNLVFNLKKYQMNTKNESINNELECYLVL